MSDDSSAGRLPAGIDSHEPQPAPAAAPLVPVSGPVEPAAPGAGAHAMGARGRSILLVDHNRESRESRAKIMRTRGVQVDCVANAEAARLRLAAGNYDLVLVDPGRERDSAESLVQEIRTNNSRQLVRFLVGSPRFVASSLSGKSSPRPLRPPAPPPIAPTVKPAAPVSGGIDFGQRIRDAEAIQDAEAQNKN